MNEENKDSYFKRTYPEEWNKRIEEAKTAKVVDEARFNEVGEKAAEKNHSKSKGGGGGGGGGGTGAGTAADNKMLLNPRAMKKGGKVKAKVAGKLATRGYGKAR